MIYIYSHGVNKIIPRYGLKGLKASGGEVFHTCSDLAGAWGWPATPI